MYRDYIESIRQKRPENKWFKDSERHHVVPRCLGGSDDPDNLIYLTYREHFIAHKILAESNPGTHKLVNAFWRMCNKDRECSPEDYELARKLFSESLKESYLGGGNPFYGKHVTPEHAAKMSKGLSKALKGRVIPESHRKHLSEANLNNPKLKGVPKSEEMKKHLSESLKGHTVSEETRKKIGDSQKGVPKGPYRKRYYNCKCVICGKDFKGTSSSQKYCTPGCKSCKKG